MGWWEAQKKEGRCRIIVVAINLIISAARIDCWKRRRVIAIVITTTTTVIIRIVIIAIEISGRYTGIIKA